MTLLWTWPIALAGLAALLLPVLLHLDRRRTLQTLRFAALRWLGSSHPARRTWRLTEWLLLALRLLLLASVAVWLAQPLLHGEQRAAQRWVAVVPGVSAEDVASAAPDPGQAVWLAPGFPRIDTPAPQGEQEIASLLRELDGRLAPQDDLVVVVPPELTGLDATSIELGHLVDWRIATTVIEAAASGSSILATPRMLALRYERDDDPSVPMVRAVVAAWSVAPSMPVQLDEGEAPTPLPTQVDALIWVGQTPSAQALRQMRDGATLLQIPAHGAPATSAWLQRIERWNETAQRVGSGRLLTLPASLPTLDPDGVRSAAFARSLHELMFGAPPPPKRARAVDVVPQQVPVAARIPERPLRPWLAWIVAALFLLERVFASSARLARAP